MPVLHGPKRSKSGSASSRLSSILSRKRVIAMSLFFETYWPVSTSFESFLERVQEKPELWRSYANRASLHPAENARATDMSAKRRIIVLAEDWCGDAIRSLPTIVALGKASPDIEVRVLNSDDYPDALSGRLTKGARAIPIAVVFDSDGNELGSWGPRPAPLQAELREKIRTEGRPTPETKGDFYAPIMAWYAKDKGRTIAQELLLVLERSRCDALAPC